MADFSDLVMSSYIHGTVQNVTNQVELPRKMEWVTMHACGLEDLDEHIFSCPGYCDIVDHEIHYDMLWNNEVLKDMKLLKKIACNMKMIIERIEDIQRIV